MILETNSEYMDSPYKGYELDLGGGQMRPLLDWLGAPRSIYIHISMENYDRNTLT